MNITKRIVHEEFLAEDIVQDVYLKALSVKLKERLNEMPEDMLLSYLVTMMKHKAYDEMKKRNREINFIDLKLEMNFCEETATNVVDKVVEKLIYNQVREEMKNLPKEDEIIIRLRYLYEFTHKEIAYALDIKEATARKRLERARNKLARLSEKYKDE